MSLDPTDSTETDERALRAATRTEAPSGGPLELLTASVRHTTRDPRAQPREGQARLRLDIDRAMRGRGMLSGIAPTGSGKSFATLTAAVQSAVLYRERTVLSTDSLALMSQLQSKDVPTVLAAAADVFPDEEVLVAFVKGVSNYVDPARVIATAQAAAEQELLAQSRVGER